MEVAEARALKASLQEKETAVAELEKELAQTRCLVVLFLWFGQMVFRI